MKYASIPTYIINVWYNRPQSASGDNRIVLLSSEGKQNFFRTIFGIKETCIRKVRMSRIVRRAHFFYLSSYDHYRWQIPVLVDTAPLTMRRDDASEMERNRMFDSSRQEVMSR